MGRLDGKVALISGGARGQGAAEARAFAKEGAKVVFGDLLDDAGRAVEKYANLSLAAASYCALDGGGARHVLPLMMSALDAPRASSTLSKLSSATRF